MKKHIQFAIVGLLLNTAPNLSAQTFTSSNLPIVVIDTYGQYIDTAYQTFVVGIGVIDHGPGVRNYLTDPFNNFNSKAEIKLRGSSTLLLPKKSYSVTTLDNFLQKNDYPLMNLPPEHDWIFKALYQDKTLLRDDLTYRIHNQMGHYSSRSVFFELVINGNYKGIYQLQEKVKRDVNRLNIDKLKDTDVSGDDLTGGYIIKLDKYLPGEEGWYSDYSSNITADSANYFLYEYPKPDSMPLVQKNYIKNYFDQFEDVLASSYCNSPDSGYSKYINTESVIDNFLINEMSKNVDGYRSSTYFYKDKDSDGDGKLHCGPVWDYNIAWKNCYYNGGNNSSGWQYQFFATENFVPFWWWQFMSDNAFKDQLKCRWQTLRGSILSFSALYGHIDSMAYYLDESQVRNFTKWPILGTFVSPNPSPVPANYAAEIANLKDWIWQRLTWMDANMPGVCSVGIQEVASLDLIHSYPNPFINNVTISYDIPEEATVKVELINSLGQKLKVLSDGIKQKGNYQEEINTSDLTSGIYVLRMTMNNKHFHQKIVKL
ncbi:MAG TPA: CotH kinase family protein [Bacteroidia bacterium]|jgi:hypothetical protein